MEVKDRIIPKKFIVDNSLSRTIIQWFKQYNAVYIHNDNPGSPHAELTTGGCSNAYFNCPEVLKFGKFNQILAKELVGKLNRFDIHESDVDWVIGSPYSSITFSYEVAKALDAVHGFTEKDPSDPKGEKMIWEKMTIPRGSNVLQIEELVTTSNTFIRVYDALMKGNEHPVNVLTTVGVLIHRPPKLPVDYGNRRIVSLVEKEVWEVEQKNCELCKGGSPRYKPESHWKELTGKG